MTQIIFMDCFNIFYKESGHIDTKYTPPQTLIDGDKAEPLHKSNSKDKRADGHRSSPRKTSELPIRITLKLGKALISVGLD